LSSNRCGAIAAATLLAAALVGGGQARAEQPPRIGIVVAVTVNTTNEEADKVAVAFGAALQQELIVDVVAGAEVARRLPEGLVSDVCVVDPACVRDVGTRLGAERLLILAIVRVGAQLQIDPTVAESATGRAVSRAAIRVADDEDPVEAFRKVAAQILPDAKARPRETKDAGQADANGSGEGSGPTIVDRDTAGGGAHGRDNLGVSSRRSSGRHMTTGAWIAAGIGVATLAGGIGFGLSARSGHADLEERGCDSTPCDQADIDDVSRRALYADLFTGAAVISSLAAALLYWRSGKAAPPIAVGASDGGLQLSLGGRF